VPSGCGVPCCVRRHHGSIDGGDHERFHTGFVRHDCADRERLHPGPAGYRRDAAGCRGRWDELAACARGARVAGTLGGADVAGTARTRLPFQRRAGSGLFRMAGGGVADRRRSGLPEYRCRGELRLPVFAREDEGLGPCHARGRFQPDAEPCVSHQGCRRRPHRAGRSATGGESAQRAQIRSATARAAGVLRIRARRRTAAAATGVPRSVEPVGVRSGWTSRGRRYAAGPDCDHPCDGRGRQPNRQSRERVGAASFRTQRARWPAGGRNARPARRVAPATLRGSRRSTRSGPGCRSKFGGRRAAIRAFRTSARAGVGSHAVHPRHQPRGEHPRWRRADGRSDGHVCHDPAADTRPHRRRGRRIARRRGRTAAGHRRPRCQPPWHTPVPPQSGASGRSV